MGAGTPANTGAAGAQPFIGSRLPGAVRYTLVDGHICHDV
ncbi:hypothetical protein YSA_07504 [Pseudomonas putida ND6]|uniref:Dihydroorotase n=1 Tax=Pseudomonas putida ND6 TaxID=231023 RepID=I3UZ98_PSEPU|nr:hypothetical protein YSA_07504 [Pseudomonas putida ND6]